MKNYPFETADFPDERMRVVSALRFNRWAHVGRYTVFIIAVYLLDIRVTE